MVESKDARGLRTQQLLNAVALVLAKEGGGNYFMEMSQQFFSEFLGEISAEVVDGEVVDGKVVVRVEIDLESLVSFAEREIARVSHEH